MKRNLSFLFTEPIGDTIQLINDTIFRLENAHISQQTIDQIYSEIKSIFLLELDKLPNIPSAESKKGQRSLRKAAPFWNSELQQLWTTRCNAEKEYLAFKCNNKIMYHRVYKDKLRNFFKIAQNNFDNKFRFL